MKLSILKNPALLVLLLLLAALSVGAALLANQHRDALVEEAMQAGGNELRILAAFAGHALQERDYQSLGPILKEWGEDTADTMEIRLVAANGFVLGRYGRPATSRYPFEISAPIEYSYTGRAVLSLTKDLQGAYDQSRHFAGRLVAAVLVIGIVLAQLFYIGARRRLEASILRQKSDALTRANTELGDEISRRRHVEEELLRQKERAEVTLHSIGDAVITVGADGTVGYLNPVAEQLTGWRDADARGRPLGEVFVARDEIDHSPVDDPVARCMEEGRVTGVTEHALLAGRDGAEYAIEVSAAPIRHVDGQVLGAVMVFRDVTETRKLVKRIAHQATHDALTGLVNRTEFKQHLLAAQEEASREPVEHALCYMDLDQFKIINDTCGHIAGDALLQQLGSLLKRHTRSQDMVARLGGDEFGILLKNCPLRKAQDIAESLCEEIGLFHFSWEDKSFDIGASVGLVQITGPPGDITHLLSQADLACYMAKELGRNRVHVYTPEDEELGRRQMDLHWASELSDALKQDRFQLYFQPIQCLREEAPAARRYEVLLRMLDKQGGYVMPGAFIPAAERYNLMSSIDRWVIKNALACYASDCAGAGPDPVFLSINLSGVSINDANLMAFIEEQFKIHEVPPDRIGFEITETAAISNLARASAFMSDMKELGCRFALDDFGSGLSSFSYLKNLPVDYLKIDGGFVVNMLDDPIDHAMVAAINDIGHVMNIETIAEFVENEDVCNELRALGVDHAQGYYTGRPARMANGQVVTGGGQERKKAG